MCGIAVFINRDSSLFLSFESTSYIPIYDIKYRQRSENTIHVTMLDLRSARFYTKWMRQFWGQINLAGLDTFQSNKGTAMVRAVSYHNILLVKS